MKLERITLHNFRQYFGPQRLTFARDQQQRVTIIHGVNGAGKTSLFLAINWCLYGEGIGKVGELISKEAMKRSQPGEQVETSVELAFLHGGQRYLTRRSLRGIKQLDGGVKVDSDTEFTMMHTRPDGQSERVRNPIGTINSILPSNVRTYFLFDGEKIDNFAKPEASQEVRNAIYLVLKLEILERAHRHLDVAAQEYRKELKHISSSELRGLISKDEKIREERNKAEKRKIEVSQEIESARRKIAEIDQQLRDTQNAQALQQQRERLERDIRQRGLELDTFVAAIRDTVANGYIVTAWSAVERAIAILNEKRERGEIPSSIRQQFLQDLLDQMRCICGRPFEEGSQPHQRLVSLMTASVPGSLEDDVLEMSATLHSFADRIEQQRISLAEAMQRRIQLLDIIKDLEGELDDVGRQLRDSPQEEVSRLEANREEFLADVESYHLEVGSLSERIEKLSKELIQLQSDISKARKHEQQERVLSSKLSLAQSAADTIQAMYERFADDMRMRIEAKTKEIFRQLIWKESHFQDIKLGSDFNLEVIDKYGLPARPELSAGERQVLSLSFITAMSRISEEEAPLVMDTPFGRLSSQHRNTITQHLPALADQLVLFVTDEELRDQARSNLEPRIGAEYRLQFDLKTSCTTIEEERRRG